MVKTKRKKAKKPSETLWSDDLYVKGYKLAASGLSKGDIARALGVSRGTLDVWMRDKPAFQRAIEEAKTDANGKGQVTFLEYVYNRLSPEDQATWGRLIESEKGEYVNDVEKVLAGQAKEVRQRLFLHALVHFNFNPSQACECVGITTKTYNEWKQGPSFRRMLQEMEWHKKNFLEGGLMGLVQKGDAAAIIFASRTLNRDRGYNDKTEITINKTVENRFSIMDLLTIEEKKMLLDRKRTREQDILKLEHKTEEDKKIQDAEFAVKEKEGIPNGKKG